MLRRLLPALMGAAAISARGGIAPAQELSAQRLVEMMIQANQAWLKSAPENLSYRLEAKHLPVDGPVEVGGGGGDGCVVTSVNTG